MKTAKIPDKLRLKILSIEMYLQESKKYSSQNLPESRNPENKSPQVTFEEQKTELCFPLALGHQGPVARP